MMYFTIFDEEICREIAIFIFDEKRYFNSCTCKKLCFSEIRRTKLDLRSMLLSNYLQVSQWANANFKSTRMTIKQRPWMLL